MKALEKVIWLCSQPGMGVERGNAYDAHNRNFDIVDLGGWLYGLMTGDCERAAQTSEIRMAATDALHEIWGDFYPAARREGWMGLLAHAKRIINEHRK